MDTQDKVKNPLPSNMEAEQYLLGSIMLNNELLNVVEDFLLPEYFTHALHIKIYVAMNKIFNKNLPISIPTISSVLHDDDDFKQNKSEEYLVFLSSNAIGVVNPKTYANIIYDIYLKRQLIAIGTDIIHQVNDLDVTNTALEKIEIIESKLFQLSEKGSIKKEFLSIDKSVSSSLESINLARKDPKNVTGITSGFTDLDKKLSGFQKSDLIIIAGRPSMGKTALALNIALNATKEQNIEKKYTIGFFSLEMSSEQLVTRMLSVLSSINSINLRMGKVSEECYNKLRDKANDLSERNIFIDDTPALSVNSIRSRARRLKRQNKLDMIIIDYLQLVRVKNNYDNRVFEISEITQGLKAIAKDLDIPVIAISQLSRAVEQRQDKKPLLSDLRDSGTIEQDADIVMFVYREEYYLSRSVPQIGSKEYEEWQEKMGRVANLAEVSIAKHRNGPIGNVNLFYENNFAKFSNLEKNF